VGDLYPDMDECPVGNFTERAINNGKLHPKAPFDREVICQIGRQNPWNKRRQLLKL
jgi:hypothetical protein